MSRIILLFAVFLSVSLGAQFSVPLRKSGTKVAPPRFRSVHSRASTGQQVLHDTYDEYYLADITVGTPPQPFTVAIDTTSSNLWVLDATCHSQDCKIGPNGTLKDTYNMYTSATFVPGDEEFLYDYENLDVFGLLAKDTLMMSGFTIANQDFGRATRVPIDFNFEPVEGVLGLGWPEQARERTIAPMKNLLPQLDKPVFTIWLQGVGKTTKQSAGRITYGGIDQTACDTDINYLPLAKPSIWGFNVDGSSMGTYTRKQTEAATSATSSAFTGVPTEVLSQIIKATKAVYDWEMSLYTVPCSTAQTAQDLTLTIGGRQYSIKPKDYVLDFNLKNNKCALAFFGATAAFGEPTWVLGEALFRNYCHIYDFGNSRIGLAKIIGN